MARGYGNGNFQPLRFICSNVTTGGIIFDNMGHYNSCVLFVQMSLLLHGHNFANMGHNFAQDAWVLYNKDMHVFLYTLNVDNDFYY